MGRKKGHKLSEIHKQHIRQALLGHRLSDKTKLKISQAHKGKGHPQTPETIEKISRSLKGKIFSKEHKLHLSQAMQGKRKGISSNIIRDKAYREKQRQAHLGKHTPHKKPRSIEHRKHLSESIKNNGSHRLERNSQWKGGLSYQDYPVGWSKEYKRFIRELYDNKCGLCNNEETAIDRGTIKKLCVHHIDYNKKNLNPINLIPLCLRCHIKTNKNRDYWKAYFSKTLR